MSGQSNVGGEVARRAPVLDAPHGTIAWSEHLEAWKAYNRNHPDQDAETIARRGGFAICELVAQLGHLPTTWLPSERTRFERGVTPTTAPAASGAGA